MLDPSLELERLKNSLKAKGISDQLAENIIQRAQAEISNAITSAVAEATQSAVMAGIEKKADEFIDELHVKRMGSSFVIGTDTGQTDFSNPPFPMVPWLLKNPKLAQDGSFYKVVPVGSKGSKSRNATSIQDIQANINDALKEASAKGFGEETGVYGAAETFSGSFAARKVAERNSSVNKAKEAKLGKQKFRTVSSKQDSGKQWVLPAQDKDMTNALAQINTAMNNAIEDAIMSVIRFYTESY